MLAIEYSTFESGEQASKLAEFLTFPYLLVDPDPVKLLCSVMDGSYEKLYFSPRCCKRLNRFDSVPIFSIDTPSVGRLLRLNSDSSPKFTEELHQIPNVSAPEPPSDDRPLVVTRHDLPGAYCAFPFTFRASLSSTFTYCTFSHTKVTPVRGRAHSADLLHRYSNYVVLSLIASKRSDAPIESVRDTRSTLLNHLHTLQHSQDTGNVGNLSNWMPSKYACNV